MTDDIGPQNITVNLDAGDNAWTRGEKIWSLSGAPGKLPADVVRAIALYMELDVKAITAASQPAEAAGETPIPEAQSADAPETVQ